MALCCTVPSDCVAPCAELGGSEWFCDAHICADSETDYCLPPTKWRDVEQALVPSDSINYSAETSLDTGNGPMQDRLILEETWTPADINDAKFGIAIGALPDGAGRAYIDIAYITVHTECE